MGMEHLNQRDWSKLVAKPLQNLDMSTVPTSYAPILWDSDVQKTQGAQGHGASTGNGSGMQSDAKRCKAAVEAKERKWWKEGTDSKKISIDPNTFSKSKQVNSD